MVETIVTSLVEFLQNTIPPQLVAFAISLFPVLELRGGMIAARLLEIPFLQAFIICYIGNMIPIPFILLFIRKIFAWMRKFKAFAKIVDKMEERSEKKKGTIQKYKEWGLLLFVAIPLPGTGGWTGALIAALMDLRFKKCLPIIALGVFIAGLIMSLITYGIF
ncbi:MAG: small multi-drug export protein [Clostridia bacterium]|nr:small multi-drug export protein [Clostridia bacterium]